MIIDFHTHIFTDEIAKVAMPKLTNMININANFDGTLKGLITNMKDNNIDYSVCVPVITNPNNVIKYNDETIRVNKLQNNVIMFGGMHPDYINYKEELLRLKNNNVVGIKLHPTFQKTDIDDDRYIKIIDEATSLGLYSIIHAGIDEGNTNLDNSDIKKIINMLNKVKDTSKIILAHFGSFEQWNDVYDNICGKYNVYFDTALSLDKIYFIDGSTKKLISKDLFKKIIYKHGVDKILFGTDNPWSNPSIVLKWLDDLDIKEEDKDKIRYQNAAFILGERL